MIVDTVFFYLVAAWYVIERISTVSIIAATVTYTIHPPSQSHKS